MEYKFIVSAYTSKKLQKWSGGWNEELKNLSRELNYYASKGNWRVKQITPTPWGSCIVYAILLERETQTKHSLVHAPPRKAVSPSSN